jgi:hypothetical protein
MSISTENRTGTLLTRSVGSAHLAPTPRGMNEVGNWWRRSPPEARGSFVACGGAKQSARPTVENPAEYCLIVIGENVNVVG